MSKKEIVYGNMLFRFFLRLCFGKILSNGTTPCPKKATSFQIKTPHPTKRFRTWKQKKTKQLNVKKNWQGGYIQFLVFSKIPKHKNTASTAFVGKKPTLTLFFCFVETMPILRENLSAHYQLKHGRKKKTTRKRKKNKRSKQNNFPVNQKTKLIHVKQEPKVKVETPT